MLRKVTPQDPESLIVESPADPANSAPAHWIPDCCVPAEKKRENIYREWELGVAQIIFYSKEPKSMST